MCPITICLRKILYKCSIIKFDTNICIIQYSFLLRFFLHFYQHILWFQFKMYVLKMHSLYLVFRCRRLIFLVEVEEKSFAIRTSNSGIRGCMWYYFKKCSKVKYTLFDSSIKMVSFSNCLPKYSSIKLVSFSNCLPKYYIEI